MRCTAHNRLAPIALVLLLLAPASFVEAQSPINLAPLTADMDTLFQGIGHDIIPALNQIALSGENLMGSAELRGWTGIYLTVLGVSATTVDGVGRVLGDTSTGDSGTWKFALLPIPNLVNTALEDDEATSDLFDTVTGKAFPFPSIRFGFGLPIANGFEFLLNGFYLPGFLVDMGIGLAGDSADMITKLGPSLDMLTVGGTFRKVILSEKRGRFRPALSFGLGYTYSSFSLAMSDFDLSDLMDEAPDVGGLGTLSMEGSARFATTVHSAGATLAISKTFLILRPFAKASAYYHFADYSSVFDVQARVTPTSGAEITQDIASSVSLQREDLSLIASAGIELVLPLVVLTVSASLDLEKPVIDITDLSLTGLELNGLGVDVALRLQI